MTRLTNTPGNDAVPIWSPDGSQIVYENDRDGSADLYVIPADGSAAARRILASPLDEFPEVWSPDGTRIVFTRITANGKVEICIMPIEGSEDPLVLFPSNQST